MFVLGRRQGVDRQDWDPRCPETWPEWLQEKAGVVARALADGELQPLADYLRAGYPVDSALAAEIAGMVDGEGGTFRLVARGRRRGQRGWSTIIADHERKMIVGVFAEAEVRARGEGGYDSAIAATTDRFGIGKTAVTKAHRYMREQLSLAKLAPGCDGWDLFTRAYSAD